MEKPMDAPVDYPVYRSDANDPEDEKQTNCRSEDKHAERPRHHTDRIAKNEASFRLEAERKLVSASRHNLANAKTLGKENFRTMDNPADSIE